MVDGWWGVVEERQPAAALWCSTVLPASYCPRILVALLLRQLRQSPLHLHRNSPCAHNPLLSPPNTLLRSLLGLAVLCNGGTYANAAPKFIAMTAFLPALLFVLGINHVRHLAPYGYAWSVAKFTTPIVALSGAFVQGEGLGGKGRVCGGGEGRRGRWGIRVLCVGLRGGEGGGGT